MDRLNEVDDKKKENDFYDDEIADLNVDLEESLDTAEKALNMGDNFEDELDKVEPEVKEEVKEVKEPESDVMVLDGKEYTKDELAKAVEMSKNPEAFIAENTKRAQRLAEDKTALDEKMAKLEKAKSSAKGDEEMETIVGLMEDMQKTLVTQQEKIDKYEQISVAQEDDRFIKDEMNRAAKVLGIKRSDLPEKGSKEFKELWDLAGNGSRIAMAYKMKNGETQTKSKANLNQLPRQTARPTTSSVAPELEREIRQTAEAMGLNADRVLARTK